MSKMNLTEATILALQGKLETTNMYSKRLKTESIDVNVDDTTNVSVENNETVVDTEDATIVVSKKDDLGDVSDVETIEVPVTGNETIIPEDTVDDAQPIDDIGDVEEIDTDLPVEVDDGETTDADVPSDIDLPLETTEDENEESEENEEEKDEAKEIKGSKIQEILKNRRRLGEHLNTSKKTEEVEIEISNDGKEVEVTTDNNENVEVVDETPEEETDIDAENAEENADSLSDEQIDVVDEEPTDETFENKQIKKESFSEDDLALTEDQMWDYLLTFNGVSEETLQIITNINGYSRETLNDVLYAVTSYRSFKQYMEAEDPDSYNEYFGNTEMEESKKVEGGPGSGDHRTSAQRHNDKLDKIFANWQNLRNAQVEYLKNNSDYTDAEIKKFADNDNLTQALIDIGKKDEFFNQYYNKNESKKPAGICKRAIKENRTVETEANKKSFNEALTKYYKKIYENVNRVTTNSVSLNENKKSMIIEATIINKNATTKDIQLEFKPISTHNNFTRYRLQENNKNVSLLTLKNKQNILECKYMNKK